MDDIKVLSYGKERSVILEALVHDKDCVLANILAASFLCSSDPFRAPSHIQAAKSLLVSLFFWLGMGTWPFFVFTSFFFLGSIWNFVILHKEQATKYEKAVFDAVIYLISQDRDDDVAVELYFKVCEDLNSLLRHSFPFMLICLFSSHVTLYLMSNVSLFIFQHQLLDWKLTWIESCDS